MITLATLGKATAQEVFDQVVNHLLTQNKKAMTGVIENCKYRIADLKCAAGCLISDEEYFEDIEGKTWISLVGNEFRGKYEGVHTHTSLIAQLQNIHDCSEPNEWMEKLQDLGAEQGLEWNYKPTTK